MYYKKRGFIGGNEMFNVREMKPYEKPQIKKVELKVEEAVLQGCKTGLAGSTGPEVNKCTVPQACSTIGT
ncbi:hypothetical protein ES703_50710 [subsurface metagenome]